MVLLISEGLVHKECGVKINTANIQLCAVTVRAKGSRTAVVCIYGAPSS